MDLTQVCKAGHFNGGIRGEAGVQTGRVSKARPGNKPGNKTTLKIKKPSIHEGFSALFDSDNRTRSSFHTVAHHVKTRTLPSVAGFFLSHAISTGATIAYQQFVGTYRGI